MTPPAGPAAAAPDDLVRALERADAALASGDLPAAQAAMADAVELCRQLEVAARPLPADTRTRLVDLHTRCGAALERSAADLRADSFRGETRRRGLASYGGPTSQR